MNDTDREDTAPGAFPPHHNSEPPALTVGDLKIELSRWRDDAVVVFRCPLRGQKLRFYRFQASPGVIEIELNDYPNTPAIRA